MNQPDKKSGPELEDGHTLPLPLFRPEALAAQQQKLYGEIVLIRPLSVRFLGWLGFAIAASVLGFLFLGQITEKSRVSGVLLSAGEGTPTKAVLIVSSGISGHVQPGTQLWLTGPANKRQSATIEQAFSAPRDPIRVPFAEKPVELDPIHAVVVTLSSPFETQQTKVEAEIPVKKSLLKWLFEKAEAMRGK